MTSTSIAPAAENIAQLPALPQKPVGLLESFASKYNVEPTKMLDTLKATVFKEAKSNEQLIALIAVANVYGLNPFLREIYAFPEKGGGIVPVVSIDGWLRIINEHPMYDGMDLVYADSADGPPAWIQCTIHRKDRARPTVIREYLVECQRKTDPWTQSPSRMLRHRSIIQCARVAFSFGGIYEPDEAERIIVNGDAREVHKHGAVAEMNRQIAGPKAAMFVDSDGKPAVVTTSERIPSGEAFKAESAPDVYSMTFAEVADRMQRANSEDSLELAGDLIGSVSDEAHRKELVLTYKDRLKELRAIKA